SGLYSLSGADMAGKRADAENAGKTLTNPIPYSIKSLARGKRLYYRNCYPCHGMGRQKGQVALTNGMLMGPDLAAAQYKAYAAGRLFYVISEGNSTMPGYSTQMSPDDRWKLVLYIQYSIQNKSR
ncbi:MAG: cytochrome c, partial [Spirochaetota bacterium]|nr:cytochrome c [Spirochaetota bacterium]